ncbi:hypothetical protein TRVL_02019 [Trypanosoma vivax]|nr:hypothetical protein TRVL_02019 [Trypanosoma vivax]
MQGSELRDQLRTDYIPLCCCFSSMFSFICLQCRSISVTKSYRSLSSDVSLHWFEFQLFLLPGSILQDGPVCQEVITTLYESGFIRCLSLSLPLPLHLHLTLTFVVRGLCCHRHIEKDIRGLGVSR